MKSEIDKYVSEIFRKKRLELGLSQQKLADMAGYSRSFINEIERIKSEKKLTVFHLNLFSEILQMSPKDWMPDKPFLEK
jgi:transcriptional regulator with XRE-family HTH domain